MIAARLPFVILAALVASGSACTNWEPLKYDKASYHMLPEGTNPNESWMSRLPDDTPLSSLSIPGTHNSWAHDYTSFGMRFLHQNSVARLQLANGIRFFDLYLREKDGNLWVSDDSLFSQDTLHIRVNFAFLGHVGRFMNEHPTEGYLIRVRMHQQDVAGGEEQLKRFIKTWGNTMRPYDPAPHAMVGVNAARCIRDPQFTGPDGKLPTLGQLRGKFLLLLDFPGADVVPHGVKRYDGLYFPADENKMFDLEDDTPGPINSFDAVEAKWHRVSRHLDEALHARANDTKTYITYTSAGGANPADYPPPPPKPKKPNMLQKFASSVKSVLWSQKSTKAVPSESCPIEPKKITNELFVSKDGYVSPAMVAGGEASAGVHRSKLRKGMNMRTLEKLSPIVGKRRIGKPYKAGIVIMDYPGHRLVDAVIGLNFPKPKTTVAAVPAQAAG